MTTYTVTLCISTALMSLEEISTYLGQPGPQSYTIGKTEEDNWEDTRWEIESLEDEEASLGSHVDSIFAQFEVKLLSNDKLPQDLDVVLDIAAFFDDFDCNFHIETEEMRFFSRHNIDLHLSCYPTTVNEEFLSRSRQ